MLTDVATLFLPVFGYAFVLGGLILLTERIHSRWTHDPINGSQKVHELPVPRVGGIAIYGGTLLAYYFTPMDPSIQATLKVLIVAGFPVFAIGLAEDLTKRVSVLMRLLVTMSAGLYAVVLSNYTIQSLGLGGWEESLLEWRLFAIGFTSFAVAGVVNATNIIDGANGLASGVVLVMLAAFASIAISVGDTSIAAVCAIIGALTIGFLVWNWPFGKIFLGDGGAYFLGFVVAWIAVMLPARNASVSPWASLLILAYPVIETVFSIARRRHLARHPGLPDRLHMHSLVRARIIAWLLPKGCSATCRNSATGFLCVFISAAPAVWAYFFLTNTPYLIVGFAITVAGYWAVYRRLTRFRWG